MEGKVNVEIETMSVLKCKLSAKMNARVKWSCQHDDWTDQKAIHKKVWQLSGRMHWVDGLSVSRTDGYVWAAHACNRFIYMLDFYETSKVSELLFYKLNQLLFWIKCTRRLLNCKVPIVYALQIL